MSITLIGNIRLGEATTCVSRLFSHIVDLESGHFWDFSITCQWGKTQISQIPTHQRSMSKSQRVCNYKDNICSYNCF